MMLQGEIEAGVSRAERGSEMLGPGVLKRKVGRWLFANQVRGPMSLVHAI